MVKLLNMLTGWTMVHLSTPVRTPMVIQIHKHFKYNILYLFFVQYSNSSSSDDREDCNHLKDFEYRACTQSSSSVVIEEEFLRAIQEDTNNDKPKDTVILNIL